MCFIVAFLCTVGLAASTVFVAVLYGFEETVHEAGACGCQFARVCGQLDYTNVIGLSLHGVCRDFTRLNKSIGSHFQLTWIDVLWQRLMIQYDLFRSSIVFPIHLQTYRITNQTILQYFCGGIYLDHCPLCKC